MRKFLRRCSAKGVGSSRVSPVQLESPGLVLFNFFSSNSPWCGRYGVCFVYHSTPANGHERGGRVSCVGPAAPLQCSLARKLTVDHPAIIELWVNYRQSNHNKINNGCLTLFGCKGCLARVLTNYYDCNNHYTQPLTTTFQCSLFMIQSVNQHTIGVVSINIIYQYQIIAVDFQ